MRFLTSCGIVLLALCGLLSMGCSGSKVEEEVSKAGDMSTLATASIGTTSKLGTANTSQETNKPKPKDEIKPFRNPFEPPKAPPKPVFKAPEPDPIPVGPNAPPDVRLLGFMNSGEPKAMVSMDGELLIVAVGDTIYNVEVVGVDAPDLTIEFNNQPIKMGLFDQDWHHTAVASSSTPAARNQSTGRPPRRSTNDPPPPIDQTSPTLPSLQSGEGGTSLPVFEGDESGNDPLSELPGFKLPGFESSDDGDAGDDLPGDTLPGLPDI